MRNTPYVELMRRFLKPGEVLCNCSKSFHQAGEPDCKHGCSAACIMSGEELAARVLSAFEAASQVKAESDRWRLDALKLREARALSGRPASADLDPPTPNDNIG
jgi:hypothetical protein